MDQFLLGWKNNISLHDKSCNADTDITGWKQPKFSFHYDK